MSLESKAMGLQSPLGNCAHSRSNQRENRSTGQAGAGPQTDHHAGLILEMIVCEKSVSTFYCPSLSQTSTVGKVSVKLFHKLSKTQLPENLPKQVLFKLETTKLLQLSAKHFQASKTPNKTAKAQTRSKVPLPSSTSG